MVMLNVFRSPVGQRINCSRVRNMTAFITPCYANTLRKRVRDALARSVLAGVLSVFLATAAWADAEIRYAAIVPGLEGYVLNADIDLDLGPRLADAVSRGVSLYFNIELVIEQPRWWWFDQKIVERRRNYRLSYNAITRSYRLSIGSLHRNYDTLEAALGTLTRVRSWPVADVAALEPGQSYKVALRFRHDKSMLPRPFQVSTIGSADWNLSTPWMEWTFLAGASR